MVTLERLKEDGKLLAYKSPEAAEYDAALYDADGYYYSTKLITTGIIYNTSAAMKPASWKDLTKQEAKGLVTMPSPLASGAALIHAQTLAAVPGLGWDFYKSLAENGAIAVSGNGAVLKSVASGEKAYGMVVDYLPIREKAKGAPVEFVFPSEGVSAVTEPVGILASTKNADAAKKFVDYVLSDKGQEGFVKLGYIPARNGMKLPEGFPRATPSRSCRSRPQTLLRIPIRISRPSRASTARTDPFMHGYIKTGNSQPAWLFPLSSSSS